MAEFMGGIVMGVLLGIFIGLGLGKASLDDRCQAGWHWKDVEYSYSCTATKRP